MRLNASPAWRCFIKLNQSEAQCRLCETIFPIKKGSTSRLLSHIRQQHPAEEREPVIIPFRRETPEYHNVASIVPGESILRSLASYWRSGDRSQDLTIYCRDGSLAAHKIVLASVSKLLYEELLENDNELIILPDFSLEQMREFLVDVYQCVDLARHSVARELGVNNNTSHVGQTRGESQGIKEEENIQIKNENLDVEENFEEANIEEERCSPVIKGKGRKNKSFAWYHFNKEGSFGVCKYCDKRFPRKQTYNMRDHILTRHFTEVKKEDLPKQFEYLLSSQSRSIKAAEGETVISGEHGFQTRVSSDGFQCLSCMKTFYNRSNCLNHWKIVHSGLKAFTCEVCEKGFTRKDTYESHMKSHLNLKEFMCSQCGKRFNRKRVRDGHEKRHDRSGYNKSCSFCAKKFLTNQQLRSHERTHTGEQPFQCDQCSRRFREKDHLLTHLRVHTGEKPYQCANCLEWFKHYSSRNNHKCKTEIQTSSHLGEETSLQ